MRLPALPRLEARRQWTAEYRVAWWRQRRRARREKFIEAHRHCTAECPSTLCLHAQNRRYAIHWMGLLKG